MSPPSRAYAALRRAILEAASAIPPGQALTFDRLGRSLNLPARHVAHVLSRLTHDEAELVPWHRVIPRDGDFGEPARRTARRQAQHDRLVAEGFASDGRRLHLDPGRLHEPDDSHATTLWVDLDD
jgi:alkylated DNA nucleotide flippase Atl1